MEKAGLFLMKFKWKAILSMGFLMAKDHLNTQIKNISMKVNGSKGLKMGKENKKHLPLSMKANLKMISEMVEENYEFIILQNNSTLQCKPNLNIMKNLE